MIVDALASAPHYRAHLLPAWEALPPARRGVAVDLADLRARHGGGAVALVASARDMGRAWRLRYRRIVMVEHGIGQSYRGIASPSYPGGPGREPVGLFLSPNETAAAADRRAYPAARVAVVGDPGLERLPGREPGPRPVLAVSFHWDWSKVPETRSAWPHYEAALRDMAARIPLIGHAHPRAQERLLPLYRRLGIEAVADFGEVCRRADVYAADNTSTLYEFAATGRPVVVLNAPGFRRDVEHGLRFWSAAGVGVNVDDPAELPAAVERALALQPADVAAREAALGIVYAHRTGAAARAAAAIEEWLCAS